MAASHIKDNRLLWQLSEEVVQVMFAFCAGDFSVLAANKAWE